MRRGDVVLVAGGGDGDYEGKPRPAVVIQAGAFVDSPSVTVCLITSINEGAPLVRIRVEPAEPNKLRKMSWVMIDKVTTIRRSNVQSIAGRLTSGQMAEVSKALPIFLGLSG